MANILEYKGWTVDKDRSAYYAFGDETKYIDIKDFICQDAVNHLITELDRIQTNLSNTVDKEDETLNLALNYLTACLTIKSGNAAQNSGIVTSERLEGMSVSYGGQNIKTGVKSPFPTDYCSLALDTINRYAAKNKLLARNTQFAVRNYRTKLFDGIYNKNLRNNRHGVP
jgi:hypothetical protein